MKDDQKKNYEKPNIEVIEVKGSSIKTGGPFSKLLLGDGFITDDSSVEM